MIHLYDAARVALVQPLRIEGEEIARVVDLGGINRAILSEELAVPEELTATLANLAQFTEDPHTLVCGPPILQHWSRR